MKTLFQSERQGKSKVAVLVSLYNYARYIREALDSVAAQTLEDVELVVCNDCSTDESASVALDWMQRHETRFSRLALVENERNSGLAATRNASVAYAEAPYLFILDADNLIRPACLARSLEILEEAAPEAAFVYTYREIFGDESAAGFSLENLDDWNLPLLLENNYIDAMVLHKRSALEAVGGYRADEYFGRLGYEDYELWLKYVRAGLYGIKIHQPLIRYRRHGTSMLNTVTNLKENNELLWQRIYELYPDLYPLGRRA